MQYNFKVVNDNLVCDKREMPLTGNVNTYRCVFDIESDIENLLWFCVFERDGKAYVQPILENECFIPHEVLVSEGKIKIGCYATNLKEDDFKRISTNWVFFNSLEGAYSDAAMPEVPEPDVWEELVLKSVPIIGENGNWFIYDITKMQYVDSGVKASGKDGEDGHTPEKGVDYFTEEDKAELLQELENDLPSPTGGASAKLKLLKTITLEEDVASVSVAFDRPLDEVAILYNVAFANAETGRFATRSNSGNWYMFFRSNLSLSTNRRYWYAHAKEVGERQWETSNSDWFTSTSGIGDSTTTPRLILSKRHENISRYIEELDIFIPNNTTENAIAAGSTIEIWGHEVDENL